MKKTFLLSLLLGVAFVGEVHAAGWDYASQAGTRPQYQRQVAQRTQTRQPQAKATYRQNGQQQVRY